MVNAGLVLEGGGMRGLYTAGVLEYFLEKICTSLTILECPQEHVWQHPIFRDKKGETKK